MNIKEEFREYLRESGPKTYDFDKKLNKYK